MKIVRLQAEAFKRLVAVDISPEPDDAVVRISGDNAAGKSSVLDAIWAVLQVRGVKVSDPIRHGEHEAVVTLTLDSDLVIERRWKATGTTLTVRSTEGAKFNSPQAMLDSLVGRLSFDPLAFANADDKKQRAMLLDVIGKADEINALDAERQAYYDERTEVGREVKRLTALRDSTDKVPDGTPVEEVDVADVAARLTEARLSRTKIDEHKATWDRLDAEEAGLRERLVEIARTRQSINNEVPNLMLMANRADALQSTLDGARETNEMVRRGRALRQVNIDLMEASQRSTGLTKSMADVDRRRLEVLRAANLPDAGGSDLSISPEGVTLDGVPFGQASAAQRLKASVAIAMAGNPDLKVIRVTDGALLDESNLAMLEEMAGAKGYQVWVERVGAEPVGIRIEDGMVAERP